MHATSRPNPASPTMPRQFIPWFVRFRSARAIYVTAAVATMCAAAATYHPTPNLQLDGGVRVGLTTAADDLGLFVGISYRH